MQDIILIGYGGHAKSIADCIEREKKYRIVGYTDSSEKDSPYSYLGSDEKLVDYFAQGICNAAIGIGYLGKGTVRQEIYSKLKNIGYNLPIIKDPTSVISESALIGEGTFIGKNAVVNADARIGVATIINTMALVEHECVVGDFSHIAVGAILCGQVQVGVASFVGANATVIQGRIIENNKIIPAGVTIR